MIVNARVAVVGRLPVLPADEAVATGRALVPPSRRRVWLGGWVEVPVYRLDGLPAGHAVKGPAIFESATTTVLLREAEHGDGDAAWLARHRPRLGGPDATMATRTVLIAGASGLVGFAAARHFARLPGWKVIAVSRRLPEGLPASSSSPSISTIALASAEVFGRMREVTHLVYAALFEKPGLFRGWREPDQMETNQRMLENLFEPLRRAATGLRHVTLLQGTKAYGAHLGPIAIPARERAPRHRHANFYWLQEDYLRASRRGRRGAGPSCDPR